MIDLAGFGQQLLLGTAMTVQLALAALAAGLVLGLIGAAGRLSRFAQARAVAAAYTTIVRGLPELLVVLIRLLAALDRHRRGLRP